MESGSQGTSRDLRLAICGWLDRLTFVSLIVVTFAIGVTAKPLGLMIPAVVLWVAKLVCARRWPRSFPLVAPMTAFLLAAAIASCFAYDPGASWSRLRTLAALLLVLVISDTVRTVARLKVLISVLLVSTLVAMGWATWQRTFGYGVTFRELPSWMVEAGVAPTDVLVRVNRERVFTPEDWVREVRAANSGREMELTFLRADGGEQYAISAPAAKVMASGLEAPDAVERWRPARAMGFYQHYLPYSYLLTLVALLTFGMTLGTKGRGRWAYAALSVVLLICLATTVTRAAMAFAIVGGLALLWHGGGRRMRAACVAGAVVGLVLGSWWIRHERGVGWISTADPGTQYRLVIWRDGLRLISEHPLVGVGFDSVVRHPEHWKLEAFRRFPLIAHFHSTFVEYAVDGGIPTLVCWAWLLGACGVLLARTTRMLAVDRSLQGIALGLFAAFVAFVGMSAVHYIGADPAIMALFWVMMGCAVAMAQFVRAHEV